MNVTREEFEALKRAVAHLELIVSGKTSMPEVEVAIQVGERLEAFHRSLEQRVYSQAEEGGQA